MLCEKKISTYINSIICNPERSFEVLPCEFNHSHTQVKDLLDHLLFGRHYMSTKVVVPQQLWNSKI